MAGILFVIFVFGGGMLFALSKTTIGHALADRIRGSSAEAAPDPPMLEEVERLRQEISELQERMDFAERLLAQKREPDRLAAGEGA